MEALEAATEETLSDVDEVGPIIAQSVHGFIQGDYGRRAVRRLAEAGVSQKVLESENTVATNQILAGKTVVVTGKLQHHTRDEIHSLVEQHGGRASSSVSQKTDFLIAGEKAGSKLTQAKKLGVAVLSEADFEALLSE